MGVGVVTFGLTLGAGDKTRDMLPWELWAEDRLGETRLGGLGRSTGMSSRAELRGDEHQEGSAMGP